MSSMSQPIEVVDRSISESARAQVVKNLTMTPEADEFLAELARKSGLSEGKVILMGLGMFRTAIDAKEQGKHIGVAQNAEDLDIELVGF